MSQFVLGETFAPDWPDDRRVPYPLIMLRLLEHYCSYNRSKIHGAYLSKQKESRKWTAYEHELPWAYEQEEFSYSVPIEELMLEVANLVLDGGRHLESEDWVNFHRSKIRAILEKADLPSMLAELPQPEREYFESDLKLLVPLGLFNYP